MGPTGRRIIAAIILICAGILAVASISGVNLPWTTSEYYYAGTVTKLAWGLQNIKLCHPDGACISMPISNDQLFSTAPTSCESAGTGALAAMIVGLLPIAIAVVLLFLKSCGTCKCYMGRLNWALMLSVVSLAMFSLAAGYWVSNCQTQINRVAGSTDITFGGGFACAICAAIVTGLSAILQIYSKCKDGHVADSRAAVDDSSVPDPLASGSATNRDAYARLADSSH